jgi:hypothetical protein
VGELTNESFSQIKDGKLTPEILRKYSGCEHYTYDQAVNIVDSIGKPAEIFFKTDFKGTEGIG